MNYEEYKKRYTESVLIDKLVSNKFNLSETSRDLGISVQKIKKLLNNPSIDMQMTFEKLSITPSYVLSNIKEVVDKSLAHTPESTIPSPNPDTPLSDSLSPSSEYYHYDPQVALKGLELLGKYHKLFTDRNENMNVQTDFETYIKTVESDKEF